MPNRATWVAFLLACFAMTALVGLFGTYAASIPLERALYRTAVLDQAAPADPQTTARAQIRAEAEREQASVASRTRLMLGVVSLLAAGLGTGILLLATKPGPATNPAARTPADSA